MAPDPLQNYVKLLGGLSRAGDQARARAWHLLAAAGLDGVADEAGGRARTLLDELSEARRANRALLQKLVADEIDRTASRWGFVRTEDLEELRQELDELRVVVIQARTERSTAEAAVSDPDASAEPPGQGDGEAERDEDRGEL